MSTDVRAALETFSNDSRHMEVAMDILGFRDPDDIVVLDIGLVTALAMVLRALPREGLAEPRLAGLSGGPAVHRVTLCFRPRQQAQCRWSNAVRYGRSTS